MTCFDMTHYAATKLQVGYIRLTDQNLSLVILQNQNIQKHHVEKDFRMYQPLPDTRHKKCHYKMLLQSLTRNCYNQSEQNKPNLWDTV